jgi:hypothetical protein
MVANSSNVELGWDLNYGSEYNNLIFANYENVSANVIVTQSDAYSPGAVWWYNEWKNGEENNEVLIPRGTGVKISSTYAILVNSTSPTSSTIQAFNGINGEWVGSPITVSIANISTIAPLGINWNSNNEPEIDQYLAASYVFNQEGNFSAGWNVTAYMIYANGTTLAYDVPTPLMVGSNQTVLTPYSNVTVGYAAVNPGNFIQYTNNEFSPNSIPSPNPPSPNSGLIPSVSLFLLGLIALFL